MFSRFAVDVAKECGQDCRRNYEWYSQPKRRRNNPFDSRLHCGVDEDLFSQYGFPLIMETIELAHLGDLVDSIIIPGSDDQNLLSLERFD